MALTTAQQLAIAVLSGDNEAIGPLMDLLEEMGMQKGGKQVPEVKRLTVSVDRLRVVVKMHDNLLKQDIEIDPDRVRQAVNEWLYDGRPLVLVGMDIELYELPIYQTHLLIEPKNRAELDQQMEDALQRAISEGRIPVQEVPQDIDQSDARTITNDESEAYNKNNKILPVHSPLPKK